MASASVRTNPRVRLATAGSTRSRRTPSGPESALLAASSASAARSSSATAGTASSPPRVRAPASRSVSTSSPAGRRRSERRRSTAMIPHMAPVWPKARPGRCTGAGGTLRSARTGAARGRLAPRLGDPSTCGGPDSEGDGPVVRNGLGSQHVVLAGGGPRTGGRRDPRPRPGTAARVPVPSTSRRGTDGPCPDRRLEGDDGPVLWRGAPCPSTAPCQPVLGVRCSTAWPASTSTWWSSAVGSPVRAWPGRRPDAACRSPCWRLGTLQPGRRAGRPS